MFLINAVLKVLFVEMYVKCYFCQVVCTAQCV